MKKLIKLITPLLLISFIFQVSGCSSFNAEKFFWGTISSEELVITDGLSIKHYTYSEKVTVVMCPESDSRDRLDIIKGRGEYARWEVILEDDFDMVAWYDYKLFILVGNTYYMFDIKEYQPPEHNYDEPVYELKEYSESQMEELYPDYKSFNWYQDFPHDYEIKF